MIDIEQTGRDAVSREFWRSEIVRNTEPPGVGYLGALIARALK